MGGLGIKDIKVLNKALLGKWLLEVRGGGTSLVCVCVCGEGVGGCHFALRLWCVEEYLEGMRLLFLEKYTIQGLKRKETCYLGIQVV